MLGVFQSVNLLEYSRLVQDFFMGFLTSLAISCDRHIVALQGYGFWSNNRGTRSDCFSSRRGPTAGFPDRLRPGKGQRVTIPRSMVRKPAGRTLRKTSAQNGFSRLT